jgi:predicted transposase/invertase (TIGR01784 family)
MNFTDELLDGKLCSSARLTLDGSGKQLSPLLRFFYIQLPFAKEDNADYVTSLESWTYILKDMNALNLPRYSENKIFNYLKEVTDVASLSPKERARYERDLKRYRDAYTLDKTYEHIIEDSKKAEARGRAEGVAEGRSLEKFDVARNLKKMNLSLADISIATGLSIKEIEDIDLN